MKVNQRTFIAQVGDLSTGIAGPDALILDIDHIMTVLRNVDTDNITSLASNVIFLKKNEDEEDQEYLEEEATLNDFLNSLAMRIFEITGINSLDSSPEASLQNLREHLDNKENPHLVTASQVGAYTKDEINNYFTVSNASINYEVFTVESIENGNFTYSDSKGGIYTGEIDGDGYFVFKLKGVELDGVVRGYKLGANSIEGIINDTLIRTKVSGGLKEIRDSISEYFSKTVGIEGLFEGAEVTFKYYSMHSFYTNHAVTHINSSDELIHIGSTSKNSNAKIEAPIWFETEE